MRHAKSDWGTSVSGDHERPLNARGERAARQMGRFLTASGAVPDLIISSTATRALRTVELASEAGSWGSAIVTDPDLYACDVETALGVLAEVDPEVGCLLVSGHEPTWSGLVGRMIGGGRVRMPTAAVACLQLPHGRWADVSREKCVLRWLVTPKMLTKK
jgi:phosphohistidine phosphatase